MSRVRVPSLTLRSRPVTRGSGSPADRVSGLFRTPAGVADAEPVSVRVPGPHGVGVLGTPVPLYSPQPGRDAPLGLRAPLGRAGGVRSGYTRGSRGRASRSAPATARSPAPGRHGHRPIVLDPVPRHTAVGFHPDAHGTPHVRHAWHDGSHGRHGPIVRSHPLPAAPRRTRAHGRVLAQEDARTTSSVGRTTWRGAGPRETDGPGAAISSCSRSIIARPISSIGWRTLVRGGSMWRAIAESS